MNSSLHLKKGFTLIELIVVLVLLGLLAVAVTPKYFTLKNEAKSSVLINIAGSVKSSANLVKLKAVALGKADGEQVINYNNVQLKLYNGYPLVDGSSDFQDINRQLTSWLELDVVDRNTARDNRSSGLFFSDKWSARNRMYIFFIQDYDSKSVNFGCQIMYENQVGSSGFRVEVLDSDC